MKLILNCFLFSAVTIVLGTVNINMTTWQYWAIDLLLVLIYFNARSEESEKNDSRQ